MLTVLDVVQSKININFLPSSALMWQNVASRTFHPSLEATITSHCVSIRQSVRGLLVLGVLDGGMLGTTGEFSQGNLKELAKK